MNPPPELTAADRAAARLRAFARLHEPGSCKLLSLANECQCPLCDIDRLAARIEAPARENAAVCPRCQHGIKHRADEPHDVEMCDDIYSERSGEVLGLVEALDAIKTLCGGHDEQSRAVQKIVDDAIQEHARWTQ